MGKTQTWLAEQVSEDTGLKVDANYIYKIMSGKRMATKVVESIDRVLEFGSPK